MQALFRMVEPEKREESKLLIDGVNIQDVGLDILRKGISILPQTPIMFTGTIKRNLDPLGLSSDADMWKAVDDVGLRSYIESLPKVWTQISLKVILF